jgi:hypothetical protein
MDPCVKLAREFKRADRAAACAPPRDSEGRERHEAAAERAAYLLPMTKPATPQGAARLLDIAASWMSGTVFGDDPPRELRDVARNWRNGRLRHDDIVAARRIVQLVKLLPRGTALAEDTQDDILSMLNNALGFMSRPRLV